jgi:hypothetical protein
MPILIALAITCFVGFSILTGIDRLGRTALKSQLDREDRRDRAAYERYLRTKPMFEWEIQQAMTEWDRAF